MKETAQTGVNAGNGAIHFLPAKNDRIPAAHS